jgi:hypothetical protein
MLSSTERHYLAGKGWKGSSEILPGWHYSEDRADNVLDDLGVGQELHLPVEQGPVNGVEFPASLYVGGFFNAEVDQRHCALLNCDRQITAVFTFLSQLRIACLPEKT